MERLQKVVRQLRLELQGRAQDGWQGSLKGAQRQTQVTLRHTHSCTSMVCVAAAADAVQRRARRSLPDLSLSRRISQQVPRHAVGLHPGRRQARLACWSAGIWAAGAR